MDKAKARDLFETACQKVGEDVPPQRNCSALLEKTFLGAYCWVVFAAGFRATILRAKFPAMKKVFRQFDPAALAEIPFPRPRSCPSRTAGKLRTSWTEPRKSMQKAGGLSKSVSRPRGWRC